ncbi:MAG TPA: hypothetical protein VHZ33_28710 [Trebonia sp.]|nr:hypothetical protein [Trebonia sp.]
MREWDLSASEQRVWDAFARRALVDLSGDGAAGGRDAAAAADWGEERTVRGEVIAALLLGAARAEPGRVPGVRLAGARIAGVIDVSDGDVAASLDLTRCALDAPPDFDGAVCGKVRLSGCALPGFTAKQAQVRGSLRFESCTVSGCLVVRNAQVQGSLHLSGSHLACPGEQALSAGGVNASGALYGGGLRVEGNLRLIGATFNGGVFLDGARLSNPDGETVTGDGITVRSIMDLGRTVHEGALSLRGAHVGSLSLEGATLRNPGGYALHADHLEVTTYLHGTGGFTADGEFCLNDAHIGTILDLKGARLRNPGGSCFSAIGIRVDAVMNCCRGFEAIGTIELYHARVGHRLCLKRARLSNPGGLAIWAEQLQTRELMLQTAGPPDGTVDLRDARVGVLHDEPASWPAVVRLEGFDYETLDPPLTGSQRLDWLQRDPGGYVPNAYEQLGGMYRRLGRGEQARVVQLAKQRRRRLTLTAAPRAWGYLQDWTVGYGYRPGRAAVGLLVLWAIGAIVFGLHHPPPADGADPRTFEPVIYTLGLLLPVIDFQQEDTFTPQGAQAWLAFVLIAAGWILTTTVAASILRALRREGD